MAYGGIPNLVRTWIAARERRLRVPQEAAEKQRPETTALAARQSSLRQPAASIDGVPFNATTSPARKPTALCPTGSTRGNACRAIL